MENLYYEAPADHIFEEVKEAAIKTWKTYDNQFGYADEKVSRIQDLENVSDNIMYIVAMFDMSNQRKLADSLTAEAKRAIIERLIAGGATFEIIAFA